MTVPCVIVGGGLTGLLTALKLSRDPDGAQGLVLLEQLPHLGGRLFFSGHNASGFGFEILGQECSDAFERHLMANLRESELPIWDELTRGFAQEPHPRSVWLVRKEWTSLAECLHAPSEFFTRKEADFLRMWSKGELPLPPTEAPLPLEKWTPWLQLTEAQKNALTPFLECLFPRGEFGRCDTTLASEFLMGELRNWQSRPSPLFHRSSRLVETLERILLARGVALAKGVTVTRLEEPNKKGQPFRMTLSGAPDPHLHAQKITLALPLLKALGFLNRDWLSGAQSKALRTRPVSLVALEYFHADEHLNAPLPASFSALSRAVFPSERCHLMKTSHGSHLFFAWLDYEESLHAPAVREAIGRMRKAAARLFKADTLQKIATRIHAQPGDIFEKIVLLPVARTLPPWSSAPDLKEVRMGLNGLYLCGDGFGFSNDPWKNIVDSVRDVSAHLTKEFRTNLQPSER